jgi:hypothetical protein
VLCDHEDSHDGLHALLVEPAAEPVGSEQAREAETVSGERYVASPALLSSLPARVVAAMSFDSSR